MAEPLVQTRPIAECERVESTLYFATLSEQQQAEVRALHDETEKQKLVVKYIHEMLAASD